jgi:hypothetical protein
VKAPQPDKGRRLPPEVQAKLGAELVEKYNEGASIRQLCAETGYSISRMRGLLIGAGVTFRPVYGGKNPTGSKE